ncbi:MAG: FG-GAP-like repeat-containing protein [Sedimentibacter sp.]|uniref:stalk domain-containing protein n=1 Tax=Sedimentibacter sp. TaxID=1960295 RepID=UPI0031592DD2
MKQTKISWLKIFEVTLLLLLFASPVIAAATEGSSAVNRTPFQFPLTNMYKEITTESEFYTYILNSVSGSVSVDGNISEVSGKESFMAEYVVPASGHPAGTIYAWLMNDQENLYVTFDVTPDNTMDGNEDYVKVYIKTNDVVKVFKVSLLNSVWGMPGFITTERANYDHKVYELKIPFSEMGLADDQNKIQIAFSAYGTMAAPIPVSFKTPDEYYSGGIPLGIATGHFNNDDYLDIVAVNANESNLSVLPNNGDGTFAARVVSAAGYSPHSVIACNLNGDNLDDLVISGSGGTYAFVSIGNFNFSPLIPCGSGYSSAVGDFDNDGDNDVATTDWNQDKIFIYSNNGEGIFTEAQSISTSNYPQAIFAEDINNDGKQDLIVVFGDRFDVSTMEIRFGDGSGHFPDLPSRIIMDIGEIIGGGMRYSAGGATAADFNDDGNIDIAFLYFDDMLNFSEYEEYASVLLGDGTGNFATSGSWSNFLLNLGPIDSVAGDFNNDGYMDLTAANRYSKNISILANSWNHTLFPKQDFSLNNQPCNLATGDFNDDGMLDIAMTNCDNGNVLVLINSTGNSSTPYSYTVTFNKNGGDTDAIPAAIEVEEPASSVGSLPEQPTRTDYTFADWWTGNGIADDGIGVDGEDGWGTAFLANTTVDDDITVYAKWVIKPADSTIDPTYASFDKYSGSSNYKDIAVTITAQSTTMSAIKNGDIVLVDGTDYSVSKSTVTINKSYLEQQATGSITLTFDFSEGADQDLIITVYDSTPSSSGGGSHYTPLTVTWSNLPEGTPGKAFSHKFLASGGTRPYKFKVTGGSLPKGLSLAEDGTFNGTPILPGTYKFTITVTDNKGKNASREFKHIIKLGPNQTLITLTVNSTQATIDGQPYTLDAAPYIEASTNRTQIGIRFVSEALGANVQWLHDSGQVKITDRDRELVLNIGKKEAIVNGKSVNLDSESVILPPGRTFVPLRFISETLGAIVDYDEVSMIITIIR